MAVTADGAIEELERTGRVVVRAAVGGIAAAILGALGFAAIGALLIWPWLSEPNWEATPAAVIGSAALIFFGVIGVPTLVWRWATASRSIVLTSEGAVLAGGSRVRWSHVRFARLMTILGQRFTVLLPRAERAADQLRGLPPIARLGAVLNGWLVRERAPVALPTQLELPAAELLRLVQHARRLGGHLR
ncbi:hypothetical protein [Agrococcus sp. Ld7]|uniref:hypothetical protein n=1 Tax=Agrococcus sp. Ld7 TaxID=649148 RepID=UPI003869DCB1